MRLNGSLIITALLVLFWGFIGCRDARQPAQETRLNVVCSFLPVYVITQNVTQGVPGVSVRVLLSPSVGCPHDYSMTPTEASMLEKADVLVMNGLGMEAFLMNNPALEKQDLQIMVATRLVDSISAVILKDESAHLIPNLESSPGHDHEEKLFYTNPHAWVSPFQAARMSKFIGRQFARIDSQYTPIYLSNAERYASRLDSLGRAFKDLIARAPNMRIVTFHRAFDYLARDCGLEIVAVIESDAGVAPSARELTRLIELINEKKPAAIFSEPQYSDRLAKMLADETGVPVSVLDPATTGPSDPESYVNIMDQNLQTLRKALYPNPEE